MNCLDWIIVCAWMGIGASLTSLVKYTLDNGFPYPLFTTAMHMLISFLFCYIALNVLHLAPKFTPLRTKDQLKHVLPIAVCQALSIGFSNMALLTLYPSFVSMINTTQPLFSILFGLLFSTEKFNLWSYLANIPVLLGTALLCYYEHHFTLIGLIFVINGVAFRAMKQVCQAKMLCSEWNFDVLGLLYMVAPIGFVLFFVWSIIQEGVQPWKALRDTAPLNVCLILCLGALCAGCHNILSFVAIKRLNATLSSMVGQMSIPSISLMSWLVFRNPISPVQCAGFLLGATGVALYDKYGRVRDIPRKGMDSDEDDEGLSNTPTSDGDVESSTSEATERTPILL